MQSNTVIYIHIGLHKTGSTALQALLVQNSSLLQQYDTLYPDAGRHIKFPLGHHDLAWSLFGQLIGRTKNVDANAWAHLIEEIQAKKPKKVILSSEEFETTSVEFIQRIQEILDGYDVRIIIYLRNPVDFMKSAYKQQTKSPTRFAGSFHDLVERNIDRCKYPQLLERWAGVFGKEAIVVHSYDGVKSGVGLYSDFFAAVDLSSCLEKCRINRRFNVSPTNMQTATLVLLNKAWWKGQHILGFRTLVDLIRFVVRRGGILGKFLSYLLSPLVEQNIFPKEELNRIGQITDPINEALFDNWLPNDQRHYLLSK